MQFNALMPELYVTNIRSSIEFYTSILRFTLEYQRSQPPFVFLSCNGAQLMLQELQPGELDEMRLHHPFGRGINFEIRTAALAEIVASLESHNYPLSRGVQESWRDIGIAGQLFGSREILVHDPDGYLLRFSETLGSRPIDVMSPGAPD